jgi:hypothetical protein
MRDRGSQRTKSSFKFLGGPKRSWLDRRCTNLVGNHRYWGPCVWNSEASAVSTKCDASATASPQLKTYHPAKLDTLEEREENKCFWKTQSIVFGDNPSARTRTIRARGLGRTNPQPPNPIRSRLTDTGDYCEGHKRGYPPTAAKCSLYTHRVRLSPGCRKTLGWLP